MRWQDLLFAHWPLDPALLRPLVPPSLAIDTFDGALAGVVPFGNARLRPFGVPLPGEAIAFAEVNVRTYVRGPTGTPAVLVPLARRRPSAWAHWRPGRRSASPITTQR